MIVILRYLHLRVGILFQERVLSAEQISTAYIMSTHCRTSIPHRLGPLPSECYSMVSTYECRNILHTRVFYAEKILNIYKMLVLSSTRTHCRPSIPLRLGPLLSECYTTISTLTCRHTLPCKSIVYREYLDHIQTVGPRRRESLPLILGPLPSDCHTMASMRTHHR